MPSSRSMKRVGFVPGHIRNVVIRIVLRAILVSMLHTSIGITNWPFLSMVLATLGISEGQLLPTFDSSELNVAIQAKKLGSKELEKRYRRFKPVNKTTTRRSNLQRQNGIYHQHQHLNILRCSRRDFLRQFSRMLRSKQMVDCLSRI